MIFISVNKKLKNKNIQILKAFKNIKLLIALIGFSILTFSSCTPPTPPPPPNEFNYNSINYPLSQGFISQMPSYGKIICTGPGISINSATTGFTGFGDGMSFVVNGSIASGVYYYDTKNETAAGKFRDCYFQVQGDAATGNASISSELVSGTLTVLLYGSNVYEITISGTTSAGGPFTSYYKGVLSLASFQ